MPDQIGDILHPDGLAITQIWLDSGPVDLSSRNDGGIALIMKSETDHEHANLENDRTNMERS